ncbi:hypothetical protein ACWGJT_23425 [Streptomyces xantholiticus]
MQLNGKRLPRRRRTLELGRRLISWVYHRRATARSQILRGACHGLGAGAITLGVFLVERYI